MQSEIIFCILYFFVCALPQGYTRTLRFESSVEVGSNITSVLQNLTTFLKGLQSLNKAKTNQALGNGLEPQTQQEALDSDEALKKVKERILQLLTGKYNFGSPTTTTVPTFFEGEAGAPPGEMNWARFWAVLTKIMKEAALNLENKTDSQAIVQEAEGKKEYSLLQNIKSGRIRGPVHVYGHHSGSKEVYADD